MLIFIFESLKVVVYFGVFILAILAFAAMLMPVVWLISLFL